MDRLGPDLGIGEADLLALEVDPLPVQAQHLPQAGQLLLPCLFAGLGPVDQFHQDLLEAPGLAEELLGKDQRLWSEWRWVPI